MKLDENGISILICCYNSSARIYKTLDALSKQQVSPFTSVEIILIDNASTDNTLTLAPQIWNELGAAFPLIVVVERKPGQLHARNKGVEASRYRYILFCDDDNWLSPNYGQAIYDSLNGDATVAACGGHGIPVFETTAPSWFDAYAEAFAVGPQNINYEDNRILNLYGAGLGVNKRALLQLKKSGFTSQLSGRAGTNLSSADDTELTYAFCLMGYKNIYRSDLLFNHYITAQRLHKNYLHRLYKAFGSDGPIRNLYYAYITSRSAHRKIKNWYLHFFLALFRLAKYVISPPKKGGRKIYFTWSIAYIKSLWSIKKGYKNLKSNIERLKSINENQYLQATLLDKATATINT